MLEFNEKQYEFNANSHSMQYATEFSSYSESQFQLMAYFDYSCNMNCNMNFRILNFLSDTCSGLLMINLAQNIQNVYFVKSS